MKNAIWIGWGFGVIFFIIELITLPHYGINWDTINHLPRGQAYLHYFLTGNKNYSDLPPWKPYWQNPESLSINADIPGDQVTSRSFYQADIADYSGYIENDGGGHPPISDILSSGFNRVLFGNLKIVNDVDSYRIYSIFLASLLVFLVFHWVASVFGKVAGVVSSLSLATYPLFWSESHFNNEKDIPHLMESLRHTDYSPEHVHVYIADNNSHDSTISLVHTFTHAFPFEYILIEHKEVDMYHCLH